MTATLGAWWPNDATACYDDLVAYRLVGASACADRITAALVSIAVESQAQGRHLYEDLNEAGRVFSQLKPDTALYRNLASSLTRASHCGRAADVQTTAQTLSDYRRAAHISVIGHTQTLLEDASTLLVHDYSSTVIGVLQGLGTSRRRRIVVTAGEPLGQGVRVARAVAAAGHNVTYTPDMSAARVIDGVDGYLTGVESFYGDGSMTNTVGTLMLSLLCREAGVPVFAPTETLKCDAERASTAQAPLVARLLHPWPADHHSHDNAWRIVQFALDAIPASLISTYVTEEGPALPTDVAAIARQALLRVLHLPDAI